MARRGDGIYQRGKVWYFDARIGGTRHVEKIGKGISRTVAAEIAGVRRAAILRGEAGIGKKRKDVAFKDARERFEKWLEANRKRRTVKSYKEALARLARTFEGQKLGTITTADLERYKESRIQGDRGKVCANRELAVLSSMVNRCRKWGLLEGENHVRDVARFKESRGRERFLDESEAARLLDVAPEPLRTVIMTGLFAGLRIEAEALPLRWRNVDFKRRLLTIEDGKNGETETVRMNDVLRQALREQQLRRGRHRGADDFVFVARDGERLHSIRTTFTTAREAAGLGEDVTPHVCRHTFGSWLALKGTPIRTIQKLMRHKRIEMTMRYAHLSPEHEQDAVDRLEFPNAFPNTDSCAESGEAVSS